MSGYGYLLHRLSSWGCLTGCRNVVNEEGGGEQRAPSTTQEGYGRSDLQLSRRVGFRSGFPVRDLFLFFLFFFSLFIKEMKDN